MKAIKSKIVGAAITSLVGFATWLTVSIQNLQTAQALNEHDQIAIRELISGTQQAVKANGDILDCMIRHHPNDRELRHDCLNSIKR